MRGKPVGISQHIALALANAALAHPHAYGHKVFVFQTLFDGKIDRVTPETPVSKALQVTVQGKAMVSPGKVIDFSFVCGPATFELPTPDMLVSLNTSDRKVVVGRGEMKTYLNGRIDFVVKT